jgi:hypothetical protein
VAYQHELPEREAFAITRNSFVYHDFVNLRKIANEFGIKRKRKPFYDRAFHLALGYSTEKIIEEDLLSVTEARKAFRRAIISGARFLDDLEAIFGNRPLYSLWNEPYFMTGGDIGEVANAFRRDELAPQVAIFVILTTIFRAQLPSPAPSRKKMLALRKWARGHLDFWVYDLGRPVTVINDRRDGYSPCHRFLRELLAEIDPASVSKLDTIVREYKAEQRAKTP